MCVCGWVGGEGEKWEDHSGRGGVQKREREDRVRETGAGGGSDCEGERKERDNRGCE